MADSSENNCIKKLPMYQGEICCLSCPSFMDKWMSVLNILIFETTAMAFLSYSILSTGGTLGFPAAVITFFSMLVCFLWTARFTGTFLNPALVISCMIKKQKSISLIKGLIYMFSEISGALIGTFIAWAVNPNDLPAPFEVYETNNQQVGSFIREIIGSFIYCTLVLILVSSDTTFVDMDIQIWTAIPLILIGVCGLFNLPLGINPAWSFTYQLVWGIYRSDFSPMTYCWTFIVGPIVGGLLAGLFFEFIFRKFIIAYKVQLKRQQELFLQRLNEQQQKKRKKRKNSEIELV